MGSAPISRRAQAILALHDFGSREGATTAKVIEQMKAAGFTEKEMAQAAHEMSK